MWQMIGVLAELERSLIGERTHAGLDAAKARGVKFGRKPKLTRQQGQQAVKLIAHGERPADVAASFHVGRTTLYRALAEAVESRPEFAKELPRSLAAIWHSVQPV